MSRRFWYRLLLAMTIASVILEVRSFWRFQIVTFAVPHRAWLDLVCHEGQLWFAIGIRNRPGDNHVLSVGDEPAFGNGGNPIYGFYYISSHLFFKLYWPLWLVPASSLGGAIWLSRPPKRVPGLCINCGYDLRAEPAVGGKLLAVCPECGSAADKPT